MKVDSTNMIVNIGFLIVAALVQIQVIQQDGRIKKLEKSTRGIREIELSRIRSRLTDLEK